MEQRSAIMSSTNDINSAIECLKKGELIIYPTDSIPGLGCDATNADAVHKLIELKKRDVNKSFIVLVSGDAMLNKYVKEVPEIAWDIIDLATTPTTIIFNEGRCLAKNVLAGDGSIAIRVVKEGVCNQLIHRFGKPLVSTSINWSNEQAATRVSEIPQEIIHATSFCFPDLSFGSGKASSILKIGTGGEIKIIRK